MLDNKQTRKPWKSGYVYALDFGDGETFKIGHTVNEPEIRVRQIAHLPTIMPKMKLVMALYTLTNCQMVETLIQMSLDDAHVKGEWFSLDFVGLVEVYQRLYAFGSVDFVR